MITRRNFNLLSATTALAPALLSSGCTAANTSPATEETFTIVAIPDTQYYCQQGPPEYFYKQTEWIKQNKQNLNIKMVAHLGDIVNIPHSKPQWNVAHNAFKIIDDHVPYILNLGNHDIGTIDQGADNRTTLLNDYFPSTRFTKNPVYENCFGPDKSAHFHKPNRSDNYYLNFSAAGLDFMVISLEFKPRDETLKWANEVLTQNPDKRCIIVTHAFLTPLGDYSNMDRYDIEGNNSDEVWDKFVKKHKNIFMLLCGHELGQSIKIGKGDNDNTVFGLLADYQGYKNSGDGYLRIMKFIPLQNKIQIKTYSPVHDKYIETHDQNFTLEYNMTTNTPASP